MRQVLTNSCLFTATECSPLENGLLVLKGDRIASVGRAEEVPLERDDEMLDCSGTTILPGLIDAHVHLIYNGVRDAYTIELQKSLEEATIDAVLHAATLLELGFTSIRDVGTRGNIAVVVRNAIREGRLPGPRIAASGRIISVWGAGDFHPTHVFGRERYAAGLAEIISGPWEARDAVRLQAKDGVDWIKVAASGTGFNPFCPAEVDTISVEELGALVDEAVEKERPVACHAESPRSIVRAAKAGARTVEHAIYLDEEGIATLLGHDVAICPTLGLYTAFAMKGLEFGIPSEIVDNHRRTHERHAQSIRSAHEAGVTIIAGSDSGLVNFPQGGGLEEICAYVEVLGMSAADAILAGTRHAARVLGFDDAGTLESGKRADLVVYRKNPLNDIRVITQPEARVAVIKAGDVVAGSLPAPTGTPSSMPAASWSPGSR